MSKQPQDPLDRSTELVMEQAVAWFTRLRSDEITDAEHEAHAEWLLSDSAHVDAFEQVEAQWQALDASRTSVLQNYASETAELTRKQQQPTIWRFGWHNLLGGRPVMRSMLAGTAAVMLLVIAGLVAFSLSTGPTSRQMLQTTTGELAQVELADGSVVDIDADSQMTFLSNRKSRIIELHQGAAVFDVAQNRQQPFTVAAGEATFTAVGTVFEVSHRNNQAMITMQEGIVIAQRGENSSQSYRLTAGDRLVYPAGAAVPLRTSVDPNQVGLWHQGQSVFAQQRLVEVVEHLNRYLPQGQLNIADPETGEILFSGVIQHDSAPQVIAQRLSGLLPVNYTMTGEQVTLYADSGTD